VPQAQPDPTSRALSAALDNKAAMPVSPARPEDKRPNRSDDAEILGLDDPRVSLLIAAQSAEQLSQLAAWLKAHAKTFTPVVMQAAAGKPGMSPLAASVVLPALSWHSQAEEDLTLQLMDVCLAVICERLTDSVRGGATDAVDTSDDVLVGAAVAVLTADRRSRHSETAVRSLSTGGPGGALILARSFDVVRDGLKLYIVRHLSPADVLELEDNAVASLSHSLSKFAENLEPPKKRPVIRFRDELGPVHEMEHSEIGATEPLHVDDAVFHARWGAGTVIASDDESVTIDFGSAGTRTLLRKYSTLRRAE